MNAQLIINEAPAPYRRLPSPISLGATHPEPRSEVKTVSPTSNDQNASHEDALASARAAVIRVLTHTAEQRDHILQAASADRADLLDNAQAEASRLVDLARGSATHIREQAQADAERMVDEATRAAQEIRAEAERILVDARDTARRLRTDAAAEALRIKATAEAEADVTLAATIRTAQELRDSLSGIYAIDARLAQITGGRSSLPAATPHAVGDDVADLDHDAIDDARIAELIAQVERAVSDGERGDATASNGLVPFVPALPDATGPSVSAAERTAQFMSDLATHLDDLDRARSGGDRAELAETLARLATTADRAQATELAVHARSLGPDATSAELDDLIRRCYGVRQKMLSPAKTDDHGDGTTVAEEPDAAPVRAGRPGLGRPSRSTDA